MPGELYSASTLSLFSGLGHQGGKARMYKVLTISNNTVFSCMVTSATIDKNPSVYSMSGAYAFNVLNIKIALINGVVEVEKTRFFYKREENGNLDIFVYLIRSDKQILFSQIRHGVGYMAISGEEVTISTEDKTEVQTS